MEAETPSWSWSWFLFMSPTLQSAMKVGRRGGGQQPGHFLPPSVLWSQGAIIYTNRRNVFSTRKEEIVPPSPALTGLYLQSSCLVTQSIECRDPAIVAARWQKQAADFTSIIVTSDECKDNGCNFFANCQTIADLSQRKITNHVQYSLAMYDLKVLQYRERAGGKFLHFCSPFCHFILTIFYEWSGLGSGVWRWGWVKHAYLTLRLPPSSPARNTSPGYTQWRHSTMWLN